MLACAIFEISSSVKYLLPCTSIVSTVKKFDKENAITAIVTPTTIKTLVKNPGILSLRLRFSLRFSISSSSSLSLVLCEFSLSCEPEASSLLSSSNSVSSVSENSAVSLLSLRFSSPLSSSVSFKLGSSSVPESTSDSVSYSTSEFSSDMDLKSSLLNELSTS